MSAIKLFHGEVSEDLLLKEKQFEGLRTKLLRGAADFYGKLEGLLKGQTDPKSRAALGQAYDELGELTGKIGNKPEALAVHLKALAVRRELAAAAGAGPTAEPGWRDARLDVARSLIAAGFLHEETGDTPGHWRRTRRRGAGRGAGGAGSCRGRSPGRPGQVPSPDRLAAVHDGEARRGAGGVRAGAGHSADAGRRQPRRRRVPA